MLYEVITLDIDHVPDPDRTFRHEDESAYEIVDQVLRVITSYSIHYTKLYEYLEGGLWRVPPLPCQRR